MSPSRDRSYIDVLPGNRRRAANAAKGLGYGGLALGGLYGVVKFGGEMMTANALGSLASKMDAPTDRLHLETEAASHYRAGLPVGIAVATVAGGILVAAGGTLVLEGIRRRRQVHFRPLELVPQRIVLLILIGRQA